MMSAKQAKIEAFRAEIEQLQREMYTPRTPVSEVVSRYAQRP